MIRRRHLFALAAATLIASPATAQTTSPSVPRRISDTSLEYHTKRVDTETAALRAGELQADWDRIRTLVAQHLQEQSYRDGPEKHAVHRAYHVDTTTNFLVSVGYRARHLAHPAQARTLIRAANMSSWHDADALVLVSPIVFVADLIRIDRKPDNSSELVYRVREPIKSAPLTGTEIRHPLNGPFPIRVPKPGDPPPPPPPPNLVAGELAGHKAAMFFRADPYAKGNFFSPMPVDVERVLPGYHSMTRETTLAAVRAAAQAQLCSPGYVPLVRGTNLPHRC